MANTLDDDFACLLLPSNQEQLADIMKALVGYRRLPFAGTSIPGAYVEAVIANVRGGEVLHTYDFVDVIKRRESIGWQVKSTQPETPVTWKRAKIPNAAELIDASRRTGATELDVQRLGDAVINFCNEHVRQSLDSYALDAIGYARVVADPWEIRYFERELVTRDRPELFRAADFRWRWSHPKRVVKKEQLPALHGIHHPTDEKWFAWHGLGENQLHFSGERVWWPDDSSIHLVSQAAPGAAAKITFAALADLLGSVEDEVERGEIETGIEADLEPG